MPKAEGNPRTDLEELTDRQKTITRLMWERNALHDDVLKLRAEVKELRAALADDLF